MFASLSDVTAAYVKLDLVTDQNREEALSLLPRGKRWMENKQSEGLVVDGDEGISHWHNREIHTLSWWQLLFQYDEPYGPARRRVLAPPCLGYLWRFPRLLTPGGPPLILTNSKNLSI